MASDSNIINYSQDWNESAIESNKFSSFMFCVFCAKDLVWMMQIEAIPFPKQDNKMGHISI